MLTEVQNKVILPSYINPTQRKRIFDPKLWPTLKNNPVFIEIDDIHHRFDATPLETVPRTVKSVKEAVTAMQTPRDFDQLNRLLAGLKHAGRQHNPRTLGVITRFLGSKGQLARVIEAARQVKRTGFRVASPPVLHSILNRCQVKAVDAGWERAETEQALKWARHALEMAALDSHKYPRGATPSTPLHRDPIALTTPLHLSAALAVGHHGGHDVDKVVTSYARQLVHAWPQDKGVQDLYPAELLKRSQIKGGVYHIASPKASYTTLAMALHGFRLASQVVEPELAKHLDALAARLEADLAAIRAALPNGLEEGSLHKKMSDVLFDANGAIKFEPKQSEPVEEPVAEVEKQAE